MDPNVVLVSDSTFGDFVNRLQHILEFFRRVNEEVDATMSSYDEDLDAEVSILGDIRIVPRESTIPPNTDRSKETFISY